jgi:hypothetical protein
MDELTRFKDEIVQNLDRHRLRYSQWADEYEAKGQDEIAEIWTSLANEHYDTINYINRVFSKYRKENPGGHGAEVQGVSDGGGTA